jgi:NNP family nitrate/nitrite transporter-like MFS transporter
MWLPWSRVAVSRALRYMDNIRDAESDSAAQAAAVRRPQTWILSMLYIGTFGSFLGCAAAFPLPIKTQFPQVHGADFAWMARCSTRWPGPWAAGRPTGGRSCCRAVRAGWTSSSGAMRDQAAGF